jgi:hypothetical protein
LNGDLSMGVKGWSYSGGYSPPSTFAVSNGQLCMTLQQTTTPTQFIVSPTFGLVGGASYTLSFELSSSEVGALTAVVVAPAGKSGSDFAASPLTMSSTLKQTSFTFTEPAAGDLQADFVFEVERFSDPTITVCVANVSVTQN